MAGGAGKRRHHNCERTGENALTPDSRPDETVEAADEGAQVAGRPVELVFGDGQEEQGG